MRKLTTTLFLASTLVAGVMAAPFVYAQDSRESSGSMMDRGMGGMMGMMNMMKQMSEMADQCSNMMSDSRPNDQWRKSTTSEPERKG